MEAEKTVVEEWLVISDYHLCDGATLPNGKPNVNEFFFADAQFKKMIALFRKQTRHVKKIGLRINGDFFDYHAVPYKGRYRCVPTEPAAIEETKAIIKAHPKVMQAIADFLIDTRAHVEFHIGNHDMEYDWPEVQRLLRERLDPHGQASERLRFVYEVQDDDTFYTHGNRFDAICQFMDRTKWYVERKISSTPFIISAVLLFFLYPSLFAVAGALFDLSFEFSLGTLALAIVGFFALMTAVGSVTHKVYFWRWGQVTRIQNVPLSTDMNSWLPARLRPWKPELGRMKDHGNIWFYSFIHDWRFALFALPVLFSYIILQWGFNQFFSWRGRNVLSGLVEMVRILKATMQEDNPLRLIRKFAEKHPEIRHIVTGHSHVPGVTKLTVNGRDVFVHNTGTGLKQVSYALRQVETRTPWPRIEAFIRRIIPYWQERPYQAVFLLAIHVIMAGLIFLLGEWLAWPLTIYIALGIALVSLLFRQSYALYKNEEFTELTPLRVKKYEDGTKDLLLQKHLEESNEFVGFMTA